MYVITQLYSITKVSVSTTCFDYLTWPSSGWDTYVKKLYIQCNIG